MLINLRNALMSGKRLPFDSEVEFLESTGTQWIDTGVYGNSDTVAELTFAMTDNSRTDAGIFGARKGYLQDCFTVLRVQSSNGAFWMHYGNEGTSANYISTVIGNTTAWHTARLARSWSIDTSTGTAGQFTFTTPTTLKVFAADMSASGRWYAKMRLASLKIYSNNLLVRDYIPVRNGTTGELYDRVSGKFAERHGDFVVGQDVVPVEYIESHGTEYIDIPVSGTPDEYFGIKGLVKITNTSQSGSAFWDTNTYRQFGASGYRMEGDGYMFVSWVGSQSVNGGWTVLPGVLYPFEVSTLGRTLLGEFQPLPRNITSAFSTLRLFGKYSSYNVNASVAFGALTITDGQGIERKPFPVRVGTEGAMMDVLTRRIYRNAGTGAFGYGNDLPYPIPA